MAQSGSFIPQQAPSRPSKVRRRRIYVLSYVVYTIFTGVVLTTIGVFFWSWQVHSALATQQATLAEERTKFDQSDIIEVLEIESLLSLVEYLLDNQPAVSRLLDAIEETTVQSVQLREFTVEHIATEDDTPHSTVKLTYTGVADSFNTVLAQRNVMESNELLRKADIKEVAYGETESESAESVSAPVTYQVSLELPVSDIAFTGAAAPVSVSETAVPTSSEAEEAVEPDKLEDNNNQGEKESVAGDSDVVNTVDELDV